MDCYTRQRCPEKPACSCKESQTDITPISCRNRSGAAAANTGADKCRGRSAADAANTGIDKCRRISAGTEDSQCGRRTRTGVSPFLTENIDQFPVAMAYVPWQQWRQIYSMDVALVRGTIFQELDKPFLMEGCRR